MANDYAGCVVVVVTLSQLQFYVDFVAAKTRFQPAQHTEWGEEEQAAQKKKTKNMRV